MPTDLGKPYALDWRGKPPHMLESDIPVWYRFLEKWGSPFLNLYYDCLLGGPYLSLQEKKDPLKWMWRVNLAKRADAIAELEDELWIIEVAPDPGLRVIGQLQTYRALWLRDPKINKIERMILVSEVPNEDLFDAASMFGISIYLI
ncbi:unnamed protein product [marine sediment metagenome]|uniref:Uncharacterized protein n=1 Tax=marine sediment metagenome TaxID=412755 RepID=X1NDL7_9ZZZZ